jgi:hypothetical protein
MENEERIYTFVSHAERRGMSVLRGGASDQEFQSTITLRLRNDPERSFHGVLSFPCSAVRELVATSDGHGRLTDDRLYCVLDTDADGRPHHGDVFATVPRHDQGVTNKTAWRRQRDQLLQVIRADFQSQQQFRDGVLNRT